MSNGRFRKPENKFTMISNSVLWDGDLSYKAKGLYATIISHLTKDNFTLYKSYLLRHCPEGEKAFDTIWNDLKDSSYLVQHKMRDEKGQIYWEYELLTEKIHTPKKEGVENAGVENAPCGKRGVYNNTLENKTLQSNTNTHTEPKNMCVELSHNIENILGTKIGKKKLETLIAECGIDKINTYLESWDKYKPFAKKGQVNYFICVVENDIPVPTPQTATYNSRKVPKYADFKQREYTDEDYEQYYANLQD